MSYTTVLKVNKRSTREILEFHNSFGSAPVVWMAIGKKYLHDELGWLNDKGKDLWKLYADKCVPFQLRVVLILTFDKCFVSKQNFQRVAKAIRFFLEQFPPEEGKANHWPKIAEFFESNPKYDRIGFNWTSVCDVWEDGTEGMFELYEALEDGEVKDVEV
jgi:hypothetical protein